MNNKNKESLKEIVYAFSVCISTISIGLTLGLLFCKML